MVSKRHTSRPLGGRTIKTSKVHLFDLNRSIKNMKTVNQNSMRRSTNKKRTTNTTLLIFLTDNIEPLLSWEREFSLFGFTKIWLSERTGYLRILLFFLLILGGLNLDQAVVSLLLKTAADIHQESRTRGPSIVAILWAYWIRLRNVEALGACDMNAVKCV